MTEQAIRVEGLTKFFKDITAVNNVSFNVNKGELFGLLGPNGAGKTTTIHILSTMLKQSSGRAIVCGFEVSKNKDEVRTKIGIVFQDPAIDTKLTGRENLEFHGRMYGMEKKKIKEKVDEVLELVELKDKADILTEKYSGGMKRRLEIARGLIHKPKILFLDEPTIGLDPQTRRHIWDYIKKLNKENKITIILTSHYMEEVDYLCNRIAIMDNGKIISLNTPEKLKNMLGGDVISLEVNASKSLINELKKNKKIKRIKEHNGYVDLTVKNAEKLIPQIISVIQKFNIKIKSVNLRKPSLEDVYLHFTGKTIREQEASHKEKMKYKYHREKR